MLPLLTVQYYVCRCSSSLSVHSSDTTEPYTEPTSVRSAEDLTSIWSAEEHESDVSYHSVWSCVGYSTSCATAYKLRDLAKCWLLRFCQRVLGRISKFGWNSSQNGDFVWLKCCFSFCLLHCLLCLCLVSMWIDCSQHYRNECTFVTLFTLFVSGVYVNRLQSTLP